MANCMSLSLLQPYASLTEKDESWDAFPWDADGGGEKRKYVFFSFSVFFPRKVAWRAQHMGNTDVWKCNKEVISVSCDRSYTANPKDETLVLI